MNETKALYKLAIVAPTCFYYQVALFRQLAAHPRIDLNVYFCSDEALKAQDVREMYHTNDDWGDESGLLAGYNHKLLPNHSPRPSYLKWPFGLMNLSIWTEIKKNKPDAVILMSWMNATWWIAIVACLFYKVPFLYMTDANVQAELTGSKWKKLIKKLFLEHCVFKLATGFLCAGTANRQLYRFYGVPDHKLVPFAYSWGYESHLKACSSLKLRRAKLRDEQGIAEDAFVVLFCGRLSPEKRIVDLLEAYWRLNRQGKTLTIVGDGQLRDLLHDYADDHNLDSVRFVGFRDRNEINNFYATADLLVLPSGRETWGIVVNEAMCFALPVIASDQVGACGDLVRDGENGFVYPSGDVDALAGRLQQIANLTDEERTVMGLTSRRLIEHWVDRDLVKSLDQYFDVICSDWTTRKQ